ncbi:MAG: SLC13 family permease, partial [Chloroflexota bacterium]
AILMITVGIISSFMNNIGATAVFLPAVLVIARRAKTVPSKLLIPLAFASAMGGNLTLIGTPPNILASSILKDFQGCENFAFNQGLECMGFGFFDFAPMGFLILGAGTLYMVFIGRHLLPTYTTQGNLTENYQVRDYLSEIQVSPESPLVGKTLIESRFGEAYNLTIIGIIRDGKDQLTVRRSDRIQANDTLLVEGPLDKILKVRLAQGLEIKPDVEHQKDSDLKSAEAGMAEVILDVGSNLAGQSLKQLHFRENHRLTVLALRRRGEAISGSFTDELLRHGDVLLVQGSRERINLIRSDPNFLLLQPVHLKERRTSKAGIALGILAAMLFVATIGWLHISVAALLAALAMVLFRVLNSDEAYQSIDWQSVFLIAGMLPLGVAMETTQAANFLADLIMTSLADLGPIAIMIGLYLLTGLLTQAMSNAATTVLLAPIAINIGLQLGGDPRAFLMVVVVAASTGFLTPIAHQSNILVFGPGGYKFTDYTKVGAGLTILLLIVVVIFLPIIWPLFPS